MRTEHLFVLIHIRNKSEVDTNKHVLALQYSLLTLQRWCFLCGSFLLLVFRDCLAVLSVVSFLGYCFRLY